ncbi:hypothetical protein LTS18_009652, partial [Coniosporium uncinatum]
MATRSVIDLTGDGDQSPQTRSKKRKRKSDGPQTPTKASNAAKITTRFNNDTRAPDTASESPIIMISSDEESDNIRGTGQSERHDASLNDLSVSGMKVINPAVAQHASNQSPSRVADGIFVLQTLSGVDLGSVSAGGRNQITSLWRDRSIAKQSTPPNLNSLFSKTGLSGEDQAKVLKAFRKLYKRGNLIDPSTTSSFMCIISESYLNKRLQGSRSSTTSTPSSTNLGHVDLTEDVTESVTAQSNATLNGTFSKHSGNHLAFMHPEPDHIATAQAVQPQPAPSSKDVEPASYSHKTHEPNRQEPSSNNTHSSVLPNSTTLRHSSKPLANDWSMGDSDKSDTMEKAQGKARQPNKRFQENRTSHSTDKSGKDSSRSVPLLAKKSASNLKLARKQGSTLSPRVSANRGVLPVEQAQSGGSERDGKMSKSSKEDAPHESGTDHVAAISGADARVQEDIALRTFKQIRDGPEVPETEGIRDIGAMMQPFELGAEKMGPHKATLNTS